MNKGPSGMNRAQRRAAARRSAGTVRRPSAPPPGPPGGTTQAGKAGLLEQGLRAQTESRFDEAEAAYRAVLREDPRCFVALANLATLERRHGRPGRAVDLLRRALDLAPDNLDIQHALGVAHYEAADYPAAIDWLHRALEGTLEGGKEPFGLLQRLIQACTFCDRTAEAARYAERMVALLPDNALAHRQLGWSYLGAKELDKARLAFAEAVRLDPNDGEARHALAGLEGETPPSADIEGVRKRYDGSAAHYDTTIVTLLQLRTADLLRDLLIARRGPAFRARSMLDLACGTGAMGTRLHAIADTLTGVDLSAGMIDRARDKAVYDRLVVDDLLSFLERDEAVHDLVTCADALIHLGDLAPLFTALAGRVTPRATLLFSVEHVQGDDYVLDRTSMRYRHGGGYVPAVLRRAGFTLETCTVEVIRVDRGEEILGGLYLARAD